MSIDGVGARSRLPGPQSAAVHQYAEQRRGVLHAQAVRRAPPQRQGDQRRAQPEDRRHPGRLRVRADAAADPGPRQRLGLLAVHRGSRRPRLRRACRSAVQCVPGRGLADAGHELPDHQLPGQRAAARRRGRSRQGQGAGRAADRAVRHAADLPRLGLRQRLQHVRPHLAGDRAGRRAVPRQRRGHRQAAHAQRQRRDGADRQHGEDQPDLRPRSGAALQRLSGGGPARRCRSARAVLGAGDGQGHRARPARCCRTAWASTGAT